MAEGARLESVFTGNRNVGSNPTPSASKPLANPTFPGLTGGSRELMRVLCALARSTNLEATERRQDDPFFGAASRHFLRRPLPKSGFTLPGSGHLTEQTGAPLTLECCA